MKYKVKVPNGSEFIKTLRSCYYSDLGDITVRVLKDNVVTITQKGDGLNPVDWIDDVLDITGGKYIE
jgi:hypothetical protein